MPQVPRGEGEPFPFQIGRTIWIAPGSLYLGELSQPPDFISRLQHNASFMKTGLKY